MTCGICSDDDHTEWACELRLGNHRTPDQDGLLPQHRRCWTCREITHAWDHQPCGQHSIPGAELPRADPPPVTPKRDRTLDLQALARAQAAEARAERGEDLDAWLVAVLARERELIRLPVPHDEIQADHPGNQGSPEDHSEQHQAGQRLPA